MASQSWVSLVNTSAPAVVGAGAALTTATTATLSPTVGTTGADVAQVNAAGQPLGWYPGLVLRVFALGFLTTTTTSTTATLFVASRASNTGSTYVTLATANGITTGTTAITGIPWFIELFVQCTAVASSGNNLSSMGRLTMGNSGAGLVANPVALTATPGMTLPMPNSAGPTAAAVDTTQSQGISVRGTLAAANATLQLSQFVVEALD